MSDVLDTCTAKCAAMPECTTCGMRKRPHGRSVGLEAENGYCGVDCPGFREEPLSGHLWPSEWIDAVYERAVARLGKNF